jgi:chromate transporter
MSSRMRRVSFAEATRVWAKIGLLSFGGPAGQIALMHKELVEERKWIDEQRFLHALNYCMLLPGPEATQLATYIGWLMHRTSGGIMAGTLFVLPGVVAMLLLSALYVSMRELPLVSALFFGLKAAVMAIVIEAVLRIAKRGLTSRLTQAIAGLAFVAIFFFAVPFPAVVLASGLFGLLGSRVLPAAFPAPRALTGTFAHETVIDAMAQAGELDHTRPSTGRSMRIVALCALLWALPLLLLAQVFGADSVFVQEGLFFSKTAVVTFGGAYAVLAYLAQRAVETYHWLLPGEMLDGLGLAETTPGPLIMVVQFVGFLGAFRHPGALSPWHAGALGALITVWVTFLPCFLWILLGAPYIEALRGNRALHAGLSCITAAVVGVILNLSLWFALHVLFRQLSEQRLGPLRLFVPQLGSIDFAALALSVMAMLAIFRFKLGMVPTLLASAGLGAAYRLLLG